MAIVSPTSIVVKIYSITGALVASFYNNTMSGENLVIECNELRNGGLDKFSFTVPADTKEPLFNDMECQIWVDGIHWFTGYAEYIPQRDTHEPIIEITGKGFVHRLKEKTVNKSYTSQTLDYIIKDIANTELGLDINVYYDVAKINVPIVSSISIQFEDKDLFEVFEALNRIANKDYQTTQYQWGIDNEKELYFSAISNDSKSHIFEGYNYQSPEVETVPSIINRILTYRTTLADSKLTEFVAVYEDTGSQGLFGLYEKKITFSDYVDTATIANIANEILEKYSEQKVRIEIENLEIESKLDIGFYELSNRRDNYFLPVNEMEDLTEWDTSRMIVSTISISEDKVFTGRKSLKLTTAVGSKDEYMEYILPEPIRFPNLFRLFVYLTDTDGSITVRLLDSNDNVVDLTLGGSGDLSGEWIKSITPITFILATSNMIIDDSVLGTDDFIVDFSATESDELTLDSLEKEWVLDITKVQIIVNNDSASIIYIDALSAEANTYLHRKIMTEEIKYTLSNSYLSSMTFGELTDSLIDGIGNSVKEGNTALAVFSKQ